VVPYASSGGTTDPATAGADNHDRTEKPSLAAYEYGAKTPLTIPGRPAKHLEISVNDRENAGKAPQPL
jgi:hypothetical protein